ncbi:hypothetical protein Pmani_012176 [Petrolisthes manimaculis]|uniref:Uncharacterized protein n=1 Tax=Petrolisthes manimaculis TaxID=1843537 RepID=A0AAE1UAQ9_9EUCA|nr:hypothetical protein Pmani_012176 [Petrolisthes manimaculis]
MGGRHVFRRGIAKPKRAAWDLRDRLLDLEAEIASYMTTESDRLNTQIKTLNDHVLAVLIFHLFFRPLVLIFHLFFRPLVLIFHHFFFLFPHLVLPLPPRPSHLPSPPSHNWLPKWARASRSHKSVDSGEDKRQGGEKRQGGGEVWPVEKGDDLTEWEMGVMG